MTDEELYNTMTEEEERECKQTLDDMGFCLGCPLLLVSHGARDTFGVPLDPTTMDCPVDFDMADAGCAQYDDWWQHAVDFIRFNRSKNEEDKTNEIC